MRLFVLPALTLALALPVSAGEGAIEINQARAEAGGITAGDTAGFPVILSSSGHYVLTSDLVVPNENTTAVSITVDHVTIDLAGFSLIGTHVCTGDNGSGLICSTPGTGVGILGVDADNVRVYDGVVRGFGNDGIRLRGTVTLDQLQI